MKRPENQSEQVFRAGWMGAAGFTLGGVAAMLLMAAIRWLDLGQRITDWLPDEQYLARILTRLLLLGLFLIIAGGVVGAFVGLILARIDPSAPRRRYISAGILAYLFSGLMLAEGQDAWADDPERIFADCRRAVMTGVQRQRLQELQERVREAEQAGDHDAVEKFIRELVEIKKSL